MKRIAQIAVLVFTLGSLAGASTIQFVGAPTGINDGSFYVLPYQVTIDGTTQLVTCIDFLDDVNSGDVWQANLLTTAQAAASGFFGAAGTLAAYERTAWLSVQPYTNTDQQIGLQHAIWNVFSSVSSTPATVSYAASADSAAASGYANFDFSGFRFIQEVGAFAGGTSSKQTLVFGTSPNSPLSPLVTTATAPEPGTLVLIGAGLVLIGLGRRKMILYSMKSGRYSQSRAVGHG